MSTTQIKTIRSVAIACFVAGSTIVGLSSVAQALTLHKGQMITVEPNGQVRVSRLPKSSASQTMITSSKPLTSRMVIWMDQAGRMGMFDYQNQRN